MRERTEMSRGRGGRPVRGRSDVHAPRSSSEIFTLRGPEGVSMPPSCRMTRSHSFSDASDDRERDLPGGEVGGLEAHRDRAAGRLAVALEPPADRRIAELHEAVVDHDRVEALALATRED